MDRKARYSTASRVALVVGILLVLVESWHLTHRIVERETDFSVFYRSAQELIGGSDAEFYKRFDQTGFYHCIPPSGTMLLSWLPLMSKQGGAAVWSLLNLLLLALSAWALYAIFAGLDRQRRLYQNTWLWAVFLLLVMASGSIQVGQYSLLLAACWIFYLWADSGNRHGLAALLLALPATVKLYPGLLFAAPVSLGRWRQVLYLIPALILLALIVPLPLYGSHLVEMWRGFFQYIIFSDGNRVEAGLRAETLANQSLDVLLLRYLTFQSVFHQAHPWFPHANLPQSLALMIASLTKVVVLIVTCFAAARLRLQASARPRWTALLMLALWTATLYLVMLETKARYTVYVFPAFLPLLAMAAARRHNLKRYVGWCVFIVLTAASVLNFVPEGTRMFGSSFIASALVWGVLLRNAWLTPAPVPANQSQPEAADAEAG